MSARKGRPASRERKRRSFRDECVHEAKTYDRRHGHRRRVSATRRFITLESLLTPLAVLSERFEVGLVLRPRC